MTMSEMVCCVEHHDECEMAGLAESCCAPDLHSDIGVLAPERSDTAYVADAASHVVVLPIRQVAVHSLLDPTPFDGKSSLFTVRSHPSPLSTVLLI